MASGDVFTSGESAGRQRQGLGAVVIPAVDNTPDAGVLAGVPSGAGVQVPQGVAAGALERVGSAAEDVAALGDACGQLCDAGLDEAARALLRARAEAERALVFHVADAMQRGVIDASDSGSARQWLLDRSKVTLEPFEVTRVVWAAEAINKPENAGLRRLFRDREVTAAQLATVVREAPKAVACLPGVDRDQILGYYVYAARHECTRRELRELTRRIVREHGGEQGSADEEKAQTAESVVWHDLPGGLWELVAVLSPGHAEQVKAAIQSLSGPRATMDADTGQERRDVRSPAKRRADALMELVGAAARVDERHGARATAKITVTMGLETLLERLDGGGYAVTEGGRSIDAGTARRLACSAEVIPAVLGSAGAPMDVGRTERTFTGALRAAIVLRDMKCTFPGCDRPPGWCEAHHVIPWWAGGVTAKSNGVLLCSRHHHVVHSRGYLATVTDTGVEWDLTPGRMQHLTPHQDAV